MKKAVIWGAGSTGRQVYESEHDAVEVVCFVDNDKKKWGTKLYDLEVRSPESLRHTEFDVVLLGTLMGLEDVPEQLQSLGVPAYKFDGSYAQLPAQARAAFLQRFAERVYKEGIEGSVAEAGVYRGDFARYINRYFYDRKLYLFDTFEGFTKEDAEIENSKSPTYVASLEGHLSEGSLEATLAKMPYPENVIARVGRFPETAEGISDRFAFVNLDMDLYQPTLEGLRFFFPLMSEGGVILIHDYFNKGYPNIERSVNDFEQELGGRLYKIPVGDNISIAILK